MCSWAHSQRVAEDWAAARSSDSDSESVFLPPHPAPLAPGTEKRAAASPWEAPRLTAKTRHTHVRSNNAGQDLSAQ